MWAGWLSTGCALGRSTNTSPLTSRDAIRVPALVWGAMILYAVVFGAMNFALYESLLVPHGDSAMYEEHLWNLLHGKGFRSYLDRGDLFLGEHVQVIHVLLVPIYLLWPSHLLLEACQSAALAAGAIPLFRIAIRHSGSARAATALAIAYLFYVPMQYLDIAVDFKTFRPNSFEIPLFLLAFDALEGRRWRTFFVALALALFCQEDAATIIAPLGVWMALCGVRSAEFGVRSAECGVRSAGEPTVPTDFRNPKSEIRNRVPPLSLRRMGASLAVFGTLYVILVIKLILPWFRNGDVHFAQYFNELGSSSNEIVLNLIRHPELVLRRLTGVESIEFALALLVPLGFLPLLSPGRLAVAIPLFGVLCLSDITNSPQHHFHAPLVPVLLWASAAGLANAPRIVARLGSGWRRVRKGPAASDEERRIEPERFAASGRSLPADSTGGAAPPLGFITFPNTTIVENAALWCLLCSFSVGFFLGLSPASLNFWDPDSIACWRKQYVPGERARRFPAVLAQIPIDSRVASTDFVHPRFTHYDRSYDYSSYRPDVPPDADYIVIDARHPHNRVDRPDEIKEFREHPEEWDVLPDVSDGYFIVLRRVKRGRK
jgi:uncharacterized membrane protein